MTVTTGNLLNGRETAAKVLAEVTERAAAFAKKSGRPPGLATVLVGENPASAAYVRQKIKACEARGVASFHRHLPQKTTRDELLREIETLNQDARVDGVIIQLPLPPQLDPEIAVATLDAKKDVDGLHPFNQGRLVRCKSWKEIESASLSLPCTPAGVMVLLSQYKIDVSGKRAVVVGRSTLVGKPLAHLLLAQDATVTIAHSKTADLPQVTQEADILIAAIGRVHFITKEMVKPGAVVVDVGISRTEAGLVGDVDFEQVKEIAQWITPVPGGVGPMTVAMLLRNTVIAAERTLQTTS